MALHRFRWNLQSICMHQKVNKEQKGFQQFINGRNSEKSLKINNGRFLFGEQTSKLIGAFIFNLSKHAIYTKIWKIFIEKRGRIEDPPCSVWRRWQYVCDHHGE